MAATAKKAAANRGSKKASSQLQHVGLDGHVHEGPDDVCGVCEALNEVEAPQPVEEQAPKDFSTPQGLRPPELFVEKSKPETPTLPKPVNNPFEALYPEGTKLFWYHPKTEGADPIPLPKVVFNQPDKVFFFDLHQVRRNPFTQMYMWMDRFEVPTKIQRHIVETVDDKEFFDMCDDWMEAIGGGATSGE